MSASRHPPNPLRSLLAEAETELSRRLHEACEAEARGVASESAEEIRRLEDSLLSAAMAAEQMLAARRHLSRAAEAASGPDAEADAKAQGDTARGAERATPPPRAEPERDQDFGTAGSHDGLASTAVREFSDETGRNWRAWPVTPGVGSAREDTRRRLGEFQDGWICFEALDSSGRRRLPRREPRWAELPREELQRLLAEAVDAREKKPGSADAIPGSGADGAG